MPKINTYQQAEANAVEFFGVTNNQNQNSIAFKNFGLFSHWYYFPNHSGFAPGKFIGYQSTTLVNYTGAGHGGVATKALGKFFTKFPTRSPQFKALLAELKQQYVGVTFSKKVFTKGGIYVPKNWSGVITDVTQIQKDNKLKETAKESLIQARVGQGGFRRDLMSRWGSCAVTGCTIPELLRASHIRPWCVSTNKQRLDPNNGLLLEANLDALFDSGLISFKNNGNMLVSARLTQPELERLGITGSLRINLNKNQRGYLKYHRDNVFKPL